VAVHDAPNERPSTACRCTRCAADLALLSPGARYCPQCGLRLNDHRSLPGTLRDTPPALLHPRDAFSSCVLRGYATAMFRLGVRYEVRHNDDEAVRCYGKASRLGNELAKSRLLEIPPARLVSPSDTPPRPA
jgi:TPR repeat protein